MSAIQIFDGCVVSTETECKFTSIVARTTISYTIYMRTRQDMEYPCIVIPVPNKGNMIRVWTKCDVDVYDSIPKSHEYISDDVMNRLLKYYDSSVWGCIILYLDMMCTSVDVEYEYDISSRKVLHVPMRQWDIMNEEEPPKKCKFNNVVTVKTKSNRQSRSFRGECVNKDMLVPLLKKTKG